MISLTVVFFIFMFFFALIGALRGWAKELLVSFSVVLSLFMILIMQTYGSVVMVTFTDLDRKYGLAEVPEGVNLHVSKPEEVQPFSALSDEAKIDFKRQFWLRTIILLVLVFFGYQTPAALTRLGRTGSVRREKFQDALLGFFLGAGNGFLIIGTVWAYMHLAHYPFEPFIIVPNQSDPLLDTANWLINTLPPIWLGTTPNIYLAVGLAFLFVLVVFV